MSQNNWKRNKILTPSLFSKLSRSLVQRSHDPVLGTQVYVYNSRYISLIETKISVRVDIDDGKNILEGEGHKVKGQGQIGDFFEHLFSL